jgi:hypothetical protein
MFRDSDCKVEGLCKLKVSDVTPFKTILATPQAFVIMGGISQEKETGD